MRTFIGRGVLMVLWRLQEISRSDWWGRKDSNLRSHEAADLQSAPFATRDTSPLNSIATTRRNGEDEAFDDAETADPITGARSARLWAKHPAQVNQSRAPTSPQAAQIAILRNP